MRDKEDFGLSCVHETHFGSVSISPKREHFLNSLMKILSFVNSHSVTCAFSVHFHLTLTVRLMLTRHTLKSACLHYQLGISHILVRQCDIQPYITWQHKFIMTISKRLWGAGHGLVGHPMVHAFPWPSLLGYAFHPFLSKAIFNFPLLLGVFVARNSNWYCLVHG